MRYLDLYVPYLDGIAEPQKTGFTSCRCPLHEDGFDKSSWSAGVNLQNGVFNCFVCGAFSPEGFIQKMENIPPEKAAIIVDEFRKQKDFIKKDDTFTVSRVPNPKWAQMVQRSQQYDLRELRSSEGTNIAETYAISKGVSIDTLESLGIGFLPASETMWKRDSLVFPYFYDGKVVGVRYRDIDGNKGGEKGCYYTLWGIDTIQEDTDIVVILEGESDRVKAHHELLKHDFNGNGVTTVSTPTGAFRAEWARELSGIRRIIGVPQGDLAASRMVKEMQEVLKGREFILKLPWKRKQQGKDLVEWMVYNPPKKFISLIETSISYGARDVLTASQFLEIADRPRQYAIDNFLAQRQIFVVAGPPKQMKTWFVINFIKCLITPGLDLAGIPGFTGCPDGRPRKVLLVEEEGDEEDLASRLIKVLGPREVWEEHVLIAHHLNVKLDQPEWVDRLEDTIELHGIDVVIYDPLQRLHDGDENSATDFGKVFSALHYLSTRFPHLVQGLIHHFNKTGDISGGWNSMRGSSRISGEVDLGIFVEKRAASEGSGIKVKFDGRTLPPVISSTGKDVHKFSFNGDTGIFTHDVKTVAFQKRDEFLSETLTRGAWPKKEAAEFFGVTTNTIVSWITKINELSQTELGHPLLREEPPAPGRSATIVYVGKDNE